jgi:hypothetical protein
MNDTGGSFRMAGRKAIDAGSESKAPAAGHADEGDFRVTDNWLDGVPIGRGEIDVLETFLAAVFDEVLEGKHAAK